MASSNNKQYDKVETIRKWRINLPSVRLMSQRYGYDVIQELHKNYPIFFRSMYLDINLCLPTGTEYGMEEFDSITLNLKNFQ